MIKDSSNYGIPLTKHYKLTPSPQVDDQVFNSSRDSQSLFICTLTFGHKTNKLLPNHWPSVLEGKYSLPRTPIQKTPAKYIPASYHLASWQVGPWPNSKCISWPYHNSSLWLSGCLERIMELNSSDSGGCGVNHVVNKWSSVIWNFVAESYPCLKESLVTNGISRLMLIQFNSLYSASRLSPVQIFHVKPYQNTHFINSNEKTQRSLRLI